jgi:hypothetical protein
VKQALRIFLKDVRGLWGLITLLMAAIGCFALLDAAGSSNAVIAVELIVMVSVWFLIGRAIHEDGLADDNEFWLTRPYDRGSLLAAKALMAVFVVAVPLLIANAAILAIQSLSIPTNLGGLALRQLYISFWLIAPPFAISSITRTAAQNVLAWIAMAAIALLTWFPGITRANNDFRFENEKYALAVALVLILSAALLQFFSRKTRWGRVMVATAILLPSPPFPESAALAIEQLRNRQPELTSRISVTAMTESVTEPARLGYRGSRHCVDVPVRVEGVPSGWQLGVLSQNDRFESAGEAWSSGWHQGLSRGESLSVCAAGDLTANPVSLRTSIALAVYEPEKPVHVRATLDTFNAPGIGQCRFVPAMQKQYFLNCRSAVWLPPSGDAGVTGKASPVAPIAPAEFPWTPFGLLPRLSPIYRWTTLAMDEGSDHFAKGEMPSSGLKTLMREGGSLEFRPKRRVAVLRREISVREVRFASLPD